MYNRGKGVAVMAEKCVAYVGTYTIGKSKGIHIYDVNTEEGSMQERKVVPVKNSSHLCFSANGKYLYSIADEGVAVFLILPDGDLEPINQIDISGMRGCYLSVGGKGKYLYVAGYHDGKVTMIHTHHNGRLGSENCGIFHRGIGSVAERNFRPHVSCVVTTPDDKFLCAVDNGIDQIKIYKINKQANSLKHEDTIRCPRESAPKIMRWSPDKKFVYLLSELSNTIDVMTYDPKKEDGHFIRIQKISVLSAKDEEGHDASSGLCFSPDGEFLFSSTAGDNIVTMFKVNKETGELTKLRSLPISGEYPKDIAVFPDGKHLASVNHESNEITTFAIDYDKHLLVMKGKPCPVDMPNCILFKELKTEAE